MEIVLIGIAACVLIASLKFLFWRSKNQGNLPPALPGLPIIGNFHQIEIGSLHISLDKFRKQFEGIFRLNVFGRNVVVLDSFDLVKEALTATTLAEVFASRPPLFPGKYILPSDVIFQPYTPKVVKLRKFMHKVIRLYGIESSSTHDIIYRETDHLLERFQNHGTESFYPLEDIHMFVANTILILEGGIDEQSIMGQLLSGDVELDDGGKINEEDMRGIVTDLIAAGVETTRQTLLSTLLFIATHRGVQQNIQTEIRRVIPLGSRITAPDKAHLPYTNAALLEHMRLYTPVPLPVFHATSRDVDFHSYQIPKDTAVLYNIWSIHHDENFWERPFDYIPERFLDENGALLSSEHEKRRRVIPFGLGKRSCPGESLSRLRTFLCVANILQNFDIVEDEASPLPPPDPRLYGQGIVLKTPAYKIRLRRK
ncbi:cytochrome P450 2U1-like isoform X4 [Haliotis rufescens]|uniref:cytochrome P450 2U1-like isoform X4 n=1 Tax=Haliotis rufescens TaxID=6454 RepID=UPI00201EC154|nr:cytochrome P450 2U1-like isoform X4 [Haliotis rufescens]